MNLEQIQHAARKLAALNEKADAIRATIEADSPTLDALRDAVNSWGTLRNRDGLKVEATYTTWQFTPHSSGAYIDATCHVIIERDNETQRAALTVRIRANYATGTVTAPSWETNDPCRNYGTKHSPPKPPPASGPRNSTTTPHESPTASPANRSKHDLGRIRASKCANVRRLLYRQRRRSQRRTPTQHPPPSTPPPQHQPITTNNHERPNP